MIKRILLIGFIFASLYSLAQEPADALRYSRFAPVGTARSMAIGGALTALGGDISSTQVNPAGIALFKTNEFVLSPGFNLNNTKSNYLGSSDKDNKSAFNFGTSGFVIASPGSGRSNWKNFSYAVTANRTANFNNTVSFKGLNNQSSYSEKYLEELINNRVTDPNKAAKDYPFGSSLAINTYLVEPNLNSNGDATGYYSLSTPQTGVRQEQVINTTGGITTLSFAGSGNLNDKLYLGGSLNWDILRYKRTQTFKESDNTASLTNKFGYFSVEDYLETSGTGLNLKLGMIFKPVEFIRVGLAVHTPSWYEMKDNYNTTLTTDLEGYAGPGTLKQSASDILGQPGEYVYNFSNPWRFMGGIAYVLREVQDVTKQRGFLTADVEYITYTSPRFSDPNDQSGTYFDELNNTISDIYKSAINVRVGGELKFNTLMVRGGFGYYSNPYKDAEIDGTRMNISGGLGYRNKGTFVDLTYMHQILKDGYYPYRLEDNAFSPVGLKGSTGNIMLTLGFKF